MFKIFLWARQHLGWHKKFQGHYPRMHPSVATGLHHMPIVRHSNGYALHCINHMARNIHYNMLAKLITQRKQNNIEYYTVCHLK